MGSAVVRASCKTTRLDSGCSICCRPCNRSRFPQLLFLRGSTNRGRVFIALNTLSVAGEPLRPARSVRYQVPSDTQLSNNYLVLPPLPPIPLIFLNNGLQGKFPAQI